MIKNDAVFGDLEYEYSWSRLVHIMFFNKNVEVMLIVSGNEKGEFSSGQYIAYQTLMNKWNCLYPKWVDAILNYYNERREELGYDEVFNSDYPEITTKKVLLEHIKLVGIKVPYAEIVDGRDIGIFFDCTWDRENGLGIRLINEEIDEIGYQDVAL